MNRPTLIQGVGTAILISALAFAADRVLNALAGGDPTPKGIAALALAAYLITLAGKNRGRAGGITLGLLCVLLLGLGYLSGATVSGMVVGGAVLIWLVRSMTFYSSLIAAAADALIGLLALGAAAWAVSAGGGVVALLWCFFLVQALHAMIPSRVGPKVTRHRRASGGDRFSRAHGAAETAIEALIRRSR